MIEVWNYGGGRQSVAIAVLIAQGKLPKPDHAVMALLKRERETTLPYLEQHVQPMLAKVGIQVEIARQEDWAREDLFAHNGKILMPMYTTQKPEIVPEAILENGVSKLPTFCSSKWKARVAERYLKKTHNLKKWRTWLGFSFDSQDARRVKRDSEGNLLPEYYYPLIQTLPLTKDDCIKVILEAGLPMPRKSTCRGCPHQTDTEWWDTKTNYPADFERAVQDEKEMQAADPHVWMHKSAKPLADVSFSPSDEYHDAQCGLGICFI